MKQECTHDADVVDWMNRVALDVVSVAGSGCDFGAVKQPFNDLTATYYSAFTPDMTTIVVRIFQYLCPPWLFSILPLPGKKTVNTASEKIKEICRNCIRNKKLNQKERQARGESINSDKDILSIAMRSGVFGDEELVWQLMTFFMAGHETTSTALSWLIYELCANPHIQDRLRAEIREHLPNILDPNSSVGAAEIDKLPYLSAVYNETLRLHPPVWLTVREASCETTIQNMPIPAGTEIIIGMSIFNRCTTFWGPDAEVFNPDRWLAPGQALTGGASSRYMNLTFLYGPHGCIGRDFACGEISSVVACLLSSMELEFTDPDYQVSIDFTGIVSRPRNLRVNFRPLATQ